MATGPHGARLSGAAPIVGAAAIMALQEVADRGEGRRRSIRHAGRLLDLLDELRVGLLTGGLPSATLADLARLAGEARDRVDSPELQQVLDEIDLRAQVELAKYEALRRSGSDAKSSLPARSKTVDRYPTLSILRPKTIPIG